MPNIYAVMAAFNRQLGRLEAGATMEMTERWKEIEARLWGYFLALVDDIERNGLKTDAQVYQLFRYQTLLKIALDEITRYEQWAQGRVEEMQQQAIDLGVAAAIASLNGAQYFVPTGNIAALKNMVGVCADGAPVFSILSQRALSPEAVAGLTAALLEGIALGYNPRKTARKMADGLAGGLDKALTIARTEQIRAFREATRQQYQDMGVKLYQRHCAHSDRTCTACLGLDGEIYPTDELFASHPNCRCFMTAYDAELAKRYPNAQEWFAGLDEARQKEILGPGHYKLYKEGMPLKDMVKITDNPVWGPTIGVKPLKEL